MKDFARSASGFSAVVSPGLEEDLLALHDRTQVGCGVQPKRLVKVRERGRLVKPKRHLTRRF
jgi:hypothetical protein